MVGSAVVDGDVTSVEDGLVTTGAELEELVELCVGFAEALDEDHAGAGSSITSTR